MALYHKYRPGKLSDLKGHDLISQILMNAAGADKLGHAYLLYGQRGTGKTSTARIIAKLINCETRHSDAEFFKQGEPCNKCRVCQEIETGRAIDVVEIDAASNRGIDEIRNLQEGIKLSPTSYKAKVFIIDEVHMLTTPAFNALLKTLEEPPSHAVFILATTELNKVPATIVSRVQTLPFLRLPLAIIAEKLKNIVKEEKIEAEGAALEMIAKQAEGSMRDAETLLDQIMSWTEKGKVITLSEVERLTGRTSSRLVVEFLKAVLTDKKDLATELVKKIEDEGYDLVAVNKDCIKYLGKLLAVTANTKMIEILKSDMTDEEIKTISQLAEEVSLEKQSALAKYLIEAHRHMRYSPFARTPLLVALVDFWSEK